MTAVQNSPALSEWNNPPAVAPRGTLIVIAGRGEHPAIYERFGSRIGFDGYRVRAVGDPTQDANAIEEQIRSLLADDDLVRPAVLVGSDAGALFAVTLAAADAVAVDALVLSGLPTPAPNSAAADWEDELTERTACPTHQARLRADGQVRPGAVAEPLPDQWFAAGELRDVEIPVLGLHGEFDTISPLAAVRNVYANAPSAQLVVISGGKHDALNDATHRTAAATIVLFLEQLRLGADLPEIAHIEIARSHS